MSEEHALVIVAGYQDLDAARRDFQTLTDRTKDKDIPLRGAVLVGKDSEGDPVVVDTGNRLGRRGAAWGAGAGLAVGLFSPALLASAAVGAAACDGAALQSVKMDVRVGGKYRLQVRRPDGEYFTTAGAYLEVTPPERLVFTWAFEADGSGDDYGEVEPPEMLVTVEFRAQGGRTEMTLIHERFASVESRDRHEQGWTRCVDALGEFLRDRVA